MTGVSKTLFIPFYFKYKESIGEKEIYDVDAVKFFENSKNLEIMDFSILDRDIYSFVGTVARTKIIDRMLLDLKESYDNVFNVGCGLDFRNRRLDIKKRWFNIDLPAVIKYRDENFEKIEGETNLTADILDINSWDFVPNETNVFILEGVSMYLAEEEIVRFLKAMGGLSKKAYFIFDTLPVESTSIKHPSVHGMDEKIEIKWGTNDIEEFSKRAGLRVIKTCKMMEELKSRFPQDDGKNEILNIMKKHCCVSLFEYEKA